MDEQDVRDIEHPGHYTGTAVRVYRAYQKDGRIHAEVECMEVLLALDLPYPLDAVFKYLWRHGKKTKNPPLKDLMKAKFYLDRYVAELQWKENHDQEEKG